VTNARSAAVRTRVKATRPLQRRRSELPPNVSALLRKTAAG